MCCETNGFPCFLRRDLKHRFNRHKFEPQLDLVEEKSKVGFCRRLAIDFTKALVVEKELLGSMRDDVIKVENLGKKYTIGHQIQKERYTSLRDVVMRNVSGVWAKTKDLITRLLQ
jgi:hypothetical protein